MAIIPLLINFLLMLVHICMTLYVSQQSTFGNTGYKILLFYHNYNSYIILFILVNTLSIFFINSSKNVRNLTLCLGLFTILFYVYFYTQFNPY